MGTPLPNPFFDPSKCDMDTITEHMLAEMNLFIPHVAREIREQRERDNDPAELLFLKKEFAPIAACIARTKK